MADVDSVVAFTAELRALDYRYGGGRCREAAVSRLPSALALLDHSAADHVSGPLHTAVADLHNPAGWSCFDTGLTDAARHFRTALTVAARGHHVADVRRPLPAGTVVAAPQRRGEGDGRVPAR